MRAKKAKEAAKEAKRKRRNGKGKCLDYYKGEWRDVDEISNPESGSEVELPPRTPIDSESEPEIEVDSVNGEAPYQGTFIFWGMQACLLMIQ